MLCERTSGWPTAWRHVLVSLHSWWPACAQDYSLYLAPLHVCDEKPNFDRSCDLLTYLWDHHRRLRDRINNSLLIIQYDKILSTRVTSHAVYCVLLGVLKKPKKGPPFAWDGRPCPWWAMLRSKLKPQLRFSSDEFPALIKGEEASLFHANRILSISLLVDAQTVCLFGKQLRQTNHGSKPCVYPSCTGRTTSSIFGRRFASCYTMIARNLLNFLHFLHGHVVRGQFYLWVKFELALILRLPRLDSQTELYFASELSLSLAV